MNYFLKNYRKTVAKDGYSIVPNRLLPKAGTCSLNGHELESHHRILLIALLACDYHGEAFAVSIRSLKSMTGMGDSTIAQAIRDLEKMRLLKVSRKKNCLTEYNLSPFYEAFLITDTNLPQPNPREPTEVPSTQYQYPDDLAAAIKSLGEK